MQLRLNGARFVLSNTNRASGMGRQPIYSSVLRRYALKKCSTWKYRMAMCGTAGRGVRVRVVFTLALRREVGEIIQKIRRQLLTASLPEAPNDRRCAECQLLHHCLPELTSAPQKVSRYMANVVFQCVT